MRGLVLFGLVVSLLRAAKGDVAPPSAPGLLSFDELVKLSETDTPGPEIQQKLDRLLHTPFVNNLASAGARPHRPSTPGLGPVLRVAVWNIERGLEFDLVRLSFSDPEAFRKAVVSRGQIEDAQWDKVLAQHLVLQEADVLILDEVDLGVTRTDYRDVAQELARSLDMNYVYGVEFLEVDPLLDLGTEQVHLDETDLTKKMQEDLRPDAERYHGLHGSAILSRYPITRASIRRLPVCHDWYHAEKAEISRIEKGKRLAADKIFLERIEREIRAGGRIALIADIQVPDVPGGKVTIVNAHLENKCKPRCRDKQMLDLLSQIKETDNPVILAGDMNTTGADGTPLSVRRLILDRLKNYEFWVTQAIKWVTPATLPLLALEPLKYFKNYLDPTSTHVPVVGSNSEAKLFRDVEKFRFADGYAFDFRGSSERNRHDKSGTLANSNQRAGKGFVPTFSMKRDFGGLFGRYKLDWFFVKAYSREPRGAGPYRFAPHHPLTMRDLNTSVPDGISDHHPITVDLPFEEPKIEPAKASPGN